MTEHNRQTGIGRGPQLPPASEQTSQPQPDPTHQPDLASGPSPTSRPNLPSGPDPAIRPDRADQPHPVNQGHLATQFDLADQTEQADRSHSRNPTAQPDWDDLPEVPFLELCDGRLQGVVSSESHAERVYASSISADDHGLNCHSNDDLRCGGLGEHAACRHIEALLAQAVKEFGASRVAAYLAIDVSEGEPLGAGLHPTSAPSHATEVFASFMRHMAYLEVPVEGKPPM